MSRAKLVLAGGLAAILLSACGITQKPVVGESHVDHRSGNHAVLDDPRTAHKKCLRKLGLGIHYFTTAASLPAIQVGKLPTGPKVVFYPVSPIYLKMKGQTQGGILIGSAVVYPNRARAKIAEKVVNCIDQGVPG
jgi:hypothetical protein